MATMMVVPIERLPFGVPPKAEVLLKISENRQFCFRDTVGIVAILELRIIEIMFYRQCVARGMKSLCFLGRGSERFFAVATERFLADDGRGAWCGRHGQTSRIVIGDGSFILFQMCL